MRVTRDLLMSGFAGHGRIPQVADHPGLVFFRNKKARDLLLILAGCGPTVAEIVILPYVLQGFGII